MWKNQETYKRLKWELNSSAPNSECFVFFLYAKLTVPIISDFFFPNKYLGMVKYYDTRMSITKVLRVLRACGKVVSDLKLPPRSPIYL